MLAISVSNSHHIYISHYLNNLAGRQAVWASNRKRTTERRKCLIVQHTHTCNLTFIRNTSWSCFHCLIYNSKQFQIFVNISIFFSTDSNQHVFRSTNCLVDTQYQFYQNPLSFFPKWKIIQYLEALCKITHRTHLVWSKEATGTVQHCE
jgi:hypothetical protein